jgi:hypothetical protein
LIAGFCLAATLGCGRASVDTLDATDGLAQYAELPGLKTTHSSALRAEYARLISEQATPAQLPPVERPPNNARSVPKPFLDGSTEVVRILTDEVRTELKRLREIYPAGKFEIGGRLPRIQDLLRKHAKQLVAYEKLLANKDRQFVVDHTAGITADLQFVEGVRLGNRIVALQIADHLEHGRLDACLAPLESLFAAIEALSRCNHMVPRAAAVQLRREALEVVRAVLVHEEADRRLAERMLQMVSLQLDRWPSDGTAWVGERAVGLHTYELIRDGHLLSLLHYDEILQLNDEVGATKLGPMVMQGLDGDELFYLTTMRAVIESCDRPYSSRQSTLQRIEKDLAVLQEGSSYPFVADQILLADVLRGQRLQGVDLARTLAWQTALRLSLGISVDERIRNPLTGFPFIIETSDGEILLAAIDPQHREPPIVLPRVALRKG